MIQMTLKIDGMQCGMCESHINDAIRRNFEVSKVTSSHRKGETVVIAKEKIAEQRLRAVIEPAGYRVVSVVTEPYEKKGLLRKIFG